MPFFGTHTDSTLFRYSLGQFVDTRTDSIPFPNTDLDPAIFLYLHRFDPLSILVGIVFRHSHGFAFSRYRPSILPFFGTHTYSTLFRYSPGQIVDSRTDSTFSRYSPGFYHFSVLTQIRPFFGNRGDSFSILVRILPFFCTHTDSTLFR